MVEKKRNACGSYPALGETHRYGRGKFDAHENYVAYMRMIVDHPNYKDMPNAKSDSGRINWQVSSGKSTSFYKDYVARGKWWARKADELGLPGKHKENDRFTLAARLIHPTGFRACRLCGDEFNVGYFYANDRLAKHLSRSFPKIQFRKGQSLSEILNLLNANDPDRLQIKPLLASLFPERSTYFERYGFVEDAFKRSNQVRSGWLTPGYMGNPPDRLDGFHDYHFGCRKKHDPGRHDSNMRSYIHDRRSFEWWAEGNWMIADALYNSAGAGRCSVVDCNKVVPKVSPDHVGPLACGFKQLSFFKPTCTHHNSAKNRRFTALDVHDLIAYEERTGESVASWQVKAHWNKFKGAIKTDAQAKALSTSLRSLQDLYMRVLFRMYEAGLVRWMATHLLHPEYAFLAVTFEGLDPSTLTFQAVKTEPKRTPSRISLAGRTVRIAFASLIEYASKPIEKRKMARSDYENHRSLIESAVRSLSKNVHANAAHEQWKNALDPTLSPDEQEKRIGALLSRPCVSHKNDADIRRTLEGVFDSIGSTVQIDFS